MGDVWKTPLGISSTTIHGDDDGDEDGNNVSDNKDADNNENDNNNDADDVKYRRLPFLPPHSCALSLSAPVKPLYSSSSSSSL